MKKAIIILAVLLIASIVANVCFYMRDGPTVEERSELRIDTIPYRLPVPVDSVVVRYTTEVLPVAEQSSGENKTSLAESVVDTMLIVSPRDSVAVTIPITQKVYEDSTFRAYVSGYKPALDSIEIYKRTETIYIRSPTKTKRWGIGIQAGCGLTPNRVQPYIGIGITYNILTF
ncbi:MAG: hypothetical protein K2H86_07000 [Muribaculaceae bacterium]|nr:hypothetical protein [Muribaculaceae bacterium]